MGSQYEPLDGSAGRHARAGWRSPLHAARFPHSRALVRPSPLRRAVMALGAPMPSRPRPPPPPLRCSLTLTAQSYPLPPRTLSIAIRGRGTPSTTPPSPPQRRLRRTTSPDLPRSPQISPDLPRSPARATSPARPARGSPARLAVQVPGRAARHAHPKDQPDDAAGGNAAWQAYPSLDRLVGRGSP